MSLLIPLGLLGLMSIAVLILIYIIKPNYQQRVVSSTYIWRLSLQIKKKRLPISKLRNILLIICQILALVAGAFIMAQPIIPQPTKQYGEEAVLILDASASMRTKNASGISRFERAVDEISDFSNALLGRGGTVTVILADATPHPIAQSVTSNSKPALVNALNSLTDNRTMPDNISCTFQETDMNAAIKLCENMVVSNPTTQIYLYTDQTYDYLPDNVQLKNMGEQSEWNAAILNAYTKLEEGYQTFYVEVACYGSVAQTISLTLYINDINDDGKSVTYYAEINCGENRTYTVVFRNENGSEISSDAQLTNPVFVPVGKNVIEEHDGKRVNNVAVFSFDNASIVIDARDNFEQDNSFSIFGGKLRTLTVQYACGREKINTYISAAINSMRKYFTEDNGLWDVKVTEVNTSKEKAAYAGFDFYVFDYCAFERVPTDGVVLFFNCPNMPAGLEWSRNYDSFSQEQYFSEEAQHAVTAGFKPEKMFVRRIQRIIAHDSRWQVLLNAANTPALLVQDTENSKMVYCAFDTEFSNIAERAEMTTLFFNIFESYLSPTVRSHVYDAGEEFQVSARGNKLTISSAQWYDQEFTDLPAKIKLAIPDTYRMEQVSYFNGKKIEDEYLFVKVPAKESNIFAKGETLLELERPELEEGTYDDLIVYIAAAMLALLFAEWFLQARDNM